VLNRYRIGTITLALTFIGLGVLTLWANLTAQPVWQGIAKWWPVVLILLGAEVILRHTLAGGQPPRWDALSIVLLFFLIGGLALGSTVMAVPGVPRFTVMTARGMPRFVANVLGTRAELTHERQIELSLQSGGNLRIDNLMGSVRVVPVTTAEYRARADIRVVDINEDAAAKLADGVRVDFTGGSKPVLAVTIPPRLQGQSVTIDLTVTVPDRMNLDVKTSFGDVDIQDIEGDLHLDTRHGNVRLADLVGDLKAFSQFGILEGSRLEGDVQIRGNHLGVELDTVTGTVEVDTGFQEVNLANIKGSVEVKTEHGPTILENIAGDVSVVSSYAAVDIDQVEGTVDLETSHGRVTFAADQVDADVDITNEYGDIVLELPTTGYRLDLESAHGEIQGSVGGASLEKETGRQTLTLGADSQGLSSDDPLVKAYTSRANIELVIR